MVVYNLKPTINVNTESNILTGNDKILQEIKSYLKPGKTIVFDCYPGVDLGSIRELLSQINDADIIFSDDYAEDAQTITKKIAPIMTDDRVFGIMSHATFADFFPKVEVKKCQSNIQNSSKLTIVYGTAAEILAPNADLLIYVGISRWEIQLRFKEGLLNWKDADRQTDALKKVKRGYFFEWRLGDRQRHRIFSKIDYYIDSDDRTTLKMVTSNTLKDSLQTAVNQPIRLVPYFEESVWGGQWMKKNFGLNQDKSNYGWAFDGVPEENSFCFQIGCDQYVIPANILVQERSKDLLGEKVQAIFGDNFPIRFDYLDTMGGQKLSLQVHPTTEYIYDHFGMSYTQNESYYIMDAKPGATVYLGVKDKADKNKMFDDLAAAEDGNIVFPVERYINQFTANKHDHFSIPSGTIHCSGNDIVVLEISQTPYLFTFKLWDWERIGLDGRPRPIHLEHGKHNINMNYDTDYVRKKFVSPIEIISNNENHLEERTGLDELEAIDTRRHWIAESTVLDNHHSVNMLNLVEGEKVRIESVDHSFPAQEFNYGETFIVPEKIHSYRVINLTPRKRIGIIQAFIRNL